MTSKAAKLIYEGTLTKKIKYLKTLSILSSTGLVGAWTYTVGKHGLTTTLGGLGAMGTPFVLTPFLIGWFYKRYVTRLYYDPSSDLYTAQHYGLLLNKRLCTFKKDDVSTADVSDVLDTFKVGEKSFYVHDEDLKDVESVRLYRRMLGLLTSESKPDGKFAADTETKLKQYEKRARIQDSF